MLVNLIFNSFIIWMSFTGFLTAASKESLDKSNKTGKAPLYYTLKFTKTGGTMSIFLRKF